MAGFRDRRSDRIDQPRDGNEVDEYCRCERRDVDRTVAAARPAFEAPSWAAMPPHLGREYAQESIEMYTQVKSVWRGSEPRRLVTERRSFGYR